jgi:3-deoxy-manno-octulosonate cytidylyltransferase (CMP-KDO synthetase)
MVWHVVERARRAARLDRVLVATDDERIRDAVRERGGEAVMTAAGHPSGTDRAAEVARGLGEADVVVNIQGDEPLLDPAGVDRLVDALRADPALAMATLRRRAGPGELQDPDVVKVVSDGTGRALYFSRAPIPYPLGGDGGGWVHVGIYAFRRERLLEFAGMPPSRLERAEGLEQLRALEAGWAIRVLDDPGRSVAVDTAADLERARALLERGG